MKGQAQFYPGKNDDYLVTADQTLFLVANPGFDMFYRHTA